MLHQQCKQVILHTGAKLRFYLCHIARHHGFYAVQCRNTSPNNGTKPSGHFNILSTGNLTIHYSIGRNISVTVNKCLLKKLAGDISLCGNLSLPIALHSVFQDYILTGNQCRSLHISIHDDASLFGSHLHPGQNIAPDPDISNKMNISRRSVGYISIQCQLCADIQNIILIRCLTGKFSGINQIIR